MLTHLTLFNQSRVISGSEQLDGVQSTISTTLEVEDVGSLNSY